jgi:hypothetical protein
MRVLFGGAGLLYLIACVKMDSSIHADYSS